VDTIKPIPLKGTIYHYPK